MSRQGRFGLVRRQWEPTLTRHDPNPPITLESEPSAVASAVTAELAKLAPELWPVLEITGLATARRYATEGYPIASASLGTFQGKVKWGGPIWHRLPSAQWTLEAVRYQLTLLDFDRDFTKLLEGVEARTLRNAVVKIRLASPSIPQADWPVRFAGRIAQQPEGAGPLAWRLQLSTFDDVFRVGKLLRHAFNPAWFPNAPSGELYGKAMALTYGILDATDGTLIGAVGSCTGYYCNTVAGAYYVWAGYGDLGHLERLFKKGVFQSNNSWTRETLVMPGFLPAQATPPFIGHRMTFFKLVSDPGNDAEFTFDCTGLTRNGIGGSGANPVPITNPALQIRHVLNNWALSAVPWTNGPWLDYNGSAWVDNALLDTPAFDAAAAWLEKRGYRGAKLIDAETIDDSTDSLRELNDWAGTHGLELFWKPTGVLSLRPYDPSKSVDLGAIPWLRAHDAEKNPVIPSGVGDAEIASEILGDGWAIPSTGGQRARMSAGDLSLPRVMRSQSRPWAVARQRFPVENLRNVKGAFLADRINVAVNGALYDGQGVAEWTNVKAVGPQHITQATASLQPLLKLGAKAGRPSVVFDGVDDVMTGPAISVYIPDAGVNTEDFSVFAAFKATANGDSSGDSTPELNRCIWISSEGGVGMALRFDGSQNYLQSFVRMSAGGVVTIATPIQLHTWYIAHMYQLASTGNFYAGVRCFTNEVKTGGNIGITAQGFLRVGAGDEPGAKFFKGEIYALIFDATGDLGSQGSTAGYVGGGWRHLIYESLADLLRIQESGWV